MKQSINRFLALSGVLILLNSASYPELIESVNRNVPKNEIEGKDILEIGSRDINGSVRWIFESKGCKSYLGTDIIPGKSVDTLINVYELDKHFKKQSFDIVICLETLEHLEYWDSAIYQMDQVLKRGGLMIVAAPRVGFPRHDWPGDYWRYEIEDWRKIFVDYDEYYADNVRETGTLYIARKKHKMQVDLKTIYLHKVKSP